MKITPKWIKLEILGAAYSIWSKFYCFDFSVDQGLSFGRRYQIYILSNVANWLM